MSFGSLNASYVELRDALRANVAVTALDDLNIRPPGDHSDEASFLRLTSWCFSLLFEVGRFSIPFLLDLNIGSDDSKEYKAVRQNVQRLRTFMNHNLGFDEGHDMEVRREVSDWFLQTCSSAFPSSHAHWEKCFDRLALDVCNVVRHCSKKLSAVLSSQEDKQMIIDDLRRRLQRALQPHEFDKIVQDSAARLGQQINARSFRNSRLAGWQSYLTAMPDHLDPRLELERVIDGQVADHFRSQLPFRTQEIMQALGLDPGPDVSKAIEIGRRLFNDGVTEKEQLITIMRAEMNVVVGNPQR